MMMLLRKLKPAVNVAIRNFHYWNKPVFLLCAFKQQCLISTPFSHQKRLFSNESAEAAPIEEKYSGARNRAGEKHGIGRLDFSDGSYYEGSFHHGILHGKGKMMWTNGDCYDGDFENNHFHGLGINKLSNGEMYVGEFENGYRCGGGIFTWPNGDRYEGSFRNNLLNGRGIMKYSNGDVYEGDFVEGNVHGLGVYKYAIGDRFEGSFENNSMLFGDYTHANGDVYKGYFQNNMKHGPGEVRFSNGDRCIGMFENNNYHGNVRHFFLNGETFLGEFQNNLRNGVGERKFTNGDSYIGTWTEGKLLRGQYYRGQFFYLGELLEEYADCGYGQFTFTDGSIREGRLVKYSKRMDDTGWFFPADVESEGLMVKKVEDKLEVIPKDDPSDLYEGQFIV